MEEIIIVGTGGHAKVVADIIEKRGDKVIGFLDGVHPQGLFLGCNILGSDDEYERFLNFKFVVAIGDPNARERIVNKMEKASWYTAIHPSAIISSLGVKIEEGTVICANVVINPFANIGKHCIINSSACVEHDNVIDDFVHISVGAKLAGSVVVKKKTWVGIGSVVKEKTFICENCMIGAGAVVVQNICLPGKYCGVPARKMKEENVNEI